MIHVDNVVVKSCEIRSWAQGSMNWIDDEWPLETKSRLFEEKYPLISQKGLIKQLDIALVKKEREREREKEKNE